MADDVTTVAQLRQLMAQFVTEREWDQFHSPKNLVMSLNVEAGELMEHFLWMTNEESRDVVNDSDTLAEIADELADVAINVLALSNALGVDMSDAVSSKLTRAAQKYPVDQSRGRYQRPDTTDSSEVPKTN